MPHRVSRAWCREFGGLLIRPDRHMEDLQDWLAPEEVEAPCSYRFTTSVDWLIGAGVMDMVRLATGRTESQEVVVSAASVRRLRIKRSV